MDKATENKEKVSASWWLGRIKSARKLEKEFRKNGREILNIYDAEKPDDTPYNILYSNTEILHPALYSATPRPVVARRFRDDDPVGRLAAQAGQRYLEYFIDPNNEDYQTFDDAMAKDVLDGVLPGRGVIRLRFEKKEVEGMLAHACVYPEHVQWDRFCHGYAKVWQDVMWEAFLYPLTREEAKKLGDKVPEMLEFTQTEQDPPESEEEKRDRASEANTEDAGDKIAWVWEVWDKRTRTVLYVAVSRKDKIDEPLVTMEDPYGLTNFYPNDEPLAFVMKSHSLTPTALYQYYRNQAKELNTLTVRLNKLISGLKLRGIYDSRIGEIEKVLEADDNKFIPAESMQQLADSVKLDNAIWLLPIEKIIAVVQGLYEQRRQCKQVIYEIMGLGDIVRGSSVASETATAQELKDKWGSLRLKKMQLRAQRHVRGTLRVALELAAKKLPPAIFAAQTGMDLPTAEVKQRAVQTAQLATQNQQPVPPAVQQVLASPSWEDVLKILQNDATRQYRIDIETNSTVDPDATEDQKNMSETLGAVGQFLQAIGPLVKDGAMPFDAAKAMLLGMVRRLRYGTEIEDQIKALQQPQQQDDAAAKAEMQVKEVETKGKLEIMEKEKELKMLELQIKKEELDMKRQEMHMKAEDRRNNIMAKRAEAMIPKPLTAQPQGGQNAGV